MIYDVSVPLNAETPIFPGDPKFKITLSHSMDKGANCNVSHLDLGAHTGTHVDAPLHMLANGEAVHGLSPEAMLGPVEVVLIDHPTAITRQELETKNIPVDGRILFKTRNSTFWEEGGFHKDFVYLAQDACDFLLEKKIRLVGTDALSIEQFGSEQFPVHCALLENDTVILEGLNLSKVSPGSFFLFCAPLLLSGADGAPARVFLADRETLAGWIM